MDRDLKVKHRLKHKNKFRKNRILDEENHRIRIPGIMEAKKGHLDFKLILEKEKNGHDDIYFAIIRFPHHDGARIELKENEYKRKFEQIKKRVDNGDYDLVVANLPYIPHARISKLDPGVRNYEPHLALDGGVRGLELIFRLLYQNLSKFIILEIDDTHTLKDFVK